MRFGVFYELQLPKPWGEQAEFRLINESIEQVQLADRLGIDTGLTTLWDEYQELKDRDLPTIPAPGIGTPDEFAAFLREFQDGGVDQSGGEEARHAGP